MGGPPGPKVGALSILGYNFAQGKWERLVSARGTDTFPNPQESMTRDGRVLVKFEATSGTVQVQQLALKAEVDAS